MPRHILPSGLLPAQGAGPCSERSVLRRTVPGPVYPPLPVPHPSSWPRRRDGIPAYPLQRPFPSVTDLPHHPLPHRAPHPDNTAKSPQHQSPFLLQTPLHPEHGRSHYQCAQSVPLPEPAPAAHNCRGNGRPCKSYCSWAPFHCACNTVKSTPKQSHGPVLPR